MRSAKERLIKHFARFVASQPDPGRLRSGHRSGRKYPGPRPLLPGHSGETRRRWRTEHFILFLTDQDEVQRRVLQQLLQPPRPRTLPVPGGQDGPGQGVRYPRTHWERSQHVPGQSAGQDRGLLCLSVRLQSLIKNLIMSSKLM